MKKITSTYLFGGLLLFTAANNVMAVTGQARIGFSSKTAGLNAVNTRTAGTSEYIEIGFVAADGIEDLSVPVTIDISDTSLVTLSNAPAGNALGNYKLTIPANATPGATASINLSATVGGVNYTRTRGFVVAAATNVEPTPTPIPTTSTMTRATTPTMKADQSGCAAINYYDVGPSKTYSALGQLPWSKLQGCDTVRIYPKPNNDAYHEMMLISAGTNMAPTAPDKFMRVIGIPDPVTGARPIIDGAADTNGALATQLETLPGGQAPRTLQYHDNASPSRILYKLGLVMVGPQQGYNYNNGPAGYIGIENLDIRNSVYNAPFSDALSGVQSAYSSFGSCLYVEAAAHLVVKNNLFHNCGNGLFINSKNSSLVELSQDVLIEGNRLYNNSNPPITGVTNGFHEHNSYTEARDIIFQYNYFGDVRPGAFGDCLKDRSSGLIVRYNTFASTCGILLNLLDSTGGGQLILGDAEYGKTYVYGNLFDVAPVGQGTNLVTYGGDSGTFANYRQGTLFFYNNTMVVKGDATHGIYPETLMFNLSIPNAVADVKNNVFYASPSTVGASGKVQAMAIGQGIVNMANNWVSPNATQYWINHLSGALLTGWNTNIGSNIQPLFVNEAQHDYRLAIGSPLIDAGADLSNITISNLPIAEPSPIAVRKQDWIMDIGAFEY